jgi:hypothetical protein
VVIGVLEADALGAGRIPGPFLCDSELGARDIGGNDLRATHSRKVSRRAADAARGFEHGHAGSDARQFGEPGGRAQRRLPQIVVIAFQEPRMNLVAIDLEHGPVHRRVVAPDDFSLEVLGVRPLGHWGLDCG